MSIPATTTFGELDPLLKFNTPAGLIPLLNSVVQTVIPTEVTVYIKSAETPAVDQQELIWHRLDVDGRPVGTYVFFGGFWVRTAPQPGAFFGLFYGDPGEFFDENGKGLSGPGPVALDYWGWQLMNGENGTANLSDKFIIGGRMDNVGITGWDNGWRTNVTGEPLTTGGSAEFTLTAESTYRASTEPLQASHYDATGAAESGGPLWGTHAGDDFDFQILPGDAGNEAPEPVTHVPPFFAMAFIQYIGPGR